jgi:hypothetical protein
MRSFSDLRSEWDLRKFIASPNGTLYFRIDLPPSSRNTIVRHLDGIIPPSLCRSYFDLTLASKQWIESRSELSELIHIETHCEIGYDFLARPHHVYQVSTASYESLESAPLVPLEMAVMRDRLRHATQVPENPAEGVIFSLLRRSFLQPSGKCYFSEGSGKFVLVDPKLTREELDSWNSLP